MRAAREGEHAAEAKVLASLLLMCAVLVTLRCSATKRRFTVADDIGLVHFGDPYTRQAKAITFSPDRRYFVVDTERGLLEQNRPESTLLFFSTEAVRHFLVHPEMPLAPSPVWTLRESTYKDGPIITHIRWLADSTGVAFLVKTASGGNQLQLATLKTKTVRALTAPTYDVVGFDIMSAESFVYSVRSPIIKQEEDETRHAVSLVGTGRSFDGLLFPSASQLYDLGELWAVRNGKRFRVDDNSGGRPLSLYSEGENTLALSPDGRFLVTAIALQTIPLEWKMKYQPPELGSAYQVRVGRQDLGALTGTGYVSEYALVDLRHKEVRALTNAPIGNAAGWWGTAAADWSADSKSVVVSNTFVTTDSQSSKGLTRRPCAAVVDVLTSHATCLEFTKAITGAGYENGWHFVESVRFAVGSNSRLTVEYSLPNGSKAATCYVQSSDDSWAPESLASGCAEHRDLLNLSVKQTLNDPPVLVATDDTAKLSRVIVDPNPSLKNIDLGKASIFQWKDRAGRDWIGGIYKPPDYVEGQRYPLVIQTHGFIKDEFRPDGIYPTAFAARELAAAGIVVLQADYCAPSVTPSEAACNVDGYEAAIEKLRDENVIDPERVGIVGFSRTCYYVLEALTASKVHYRAASITDGLNFGYLQYLMGVDSGSNWLSHEANAVIGAPPFGDGLQRWTKVSPTFNMQEITTPLQIVALGQLSLVGMWEPYAALRYLAKPVDLVVVEQGTHVLTNPAERMVSQEGTVDWFRFWLKREEDPSREKAAQYARWHQLQDLMKTARTSESR